MLQGKLGSLALCLIGCAASSCGKQHGRWSLPQYSRNLMDECDTLADIVTRIRGGSDPYYGDYGRRKISQYGQHDDYNSQQDYYGQDDDTNDEDDDNDEDQSFSGSFKQPPRSRREYYYDDYDDMRRPAQPGPDVSSIFQSLPSVIKNGDRRIGFGLLGSGALVTMLGVSLFFNKALMRMGNLLFIAGVPIALGPSRTMAYFFKPEKFRATVCLGLGIFLVLVGSPVFGIALEIFGLLNLFGNMFPVILAIAKNMPVIGPILSGNNSNNNNSNNNGYGGSRGRGRGRNRYDDDPYYDDRGYEDEYYEDDYGRRDEYSRRDDYGGRNSYY